MRLLSFISVVALAVTLVACGPIYKTVYDYKPPASTSGKMCTNQCMQNKISCDQICSIKTEACRSQAKQTALYEYEIYKTQRERDRLPVDKTVSSFDRSWNCNNSCGCESNYRLCYSTCGGQVSERQVCTAFCDKK